MQLTAEYDPFELTESVVVKSNKGIDLDLLGLMVLVALVTAEMRTSYVQSSLDYGPSAVGKS